jgi:diguanylate cyclase (GGDEF)-like protein
MANDGPRRLAIGLALPLSWLAFVATVVFRANPGEFNPWFDAGVYNVTFVLAAVACLRRSATRPHARAGWRVLGVGFAVYTAGNLHGSLIVGDQEWYPSPADVLWLSFYVTLYVALILFVKARITRFLASSWLDGAIGGLGGAALAVAFVLGPVLVLTGGAFSVVATNLAYPTADLLLIIVLIAGGNAMQARDASWWLLVAGIGVFCIGDLGYLFTEAAGSYAEGGLLDISWPLGAVLVGIAACVIGDESTVGDLEQRYLIPVTFTLVSVGLLVFGQRHTLPGIAIALAVAALAMAAGRVTLTVREVTLLAESRREARTDDLTGLANRRRLLEQLTDRIADPGTTTALLILDLDRFKEVNDSLGHGAGDELLSAIGRRLAPVIPAPALLARLGGDEFAAVLPDQDIDQALRAAERLREALTEPFTVSGMLIPVDASIGVACAPRHAGTAESLMSCADIAMYRAKRSRTGVEAFQSGHDQPSIGRMALLGELHTALTQRQLTLYYQPQLNLRTGRICGIEALVRWQHPHRGLMAPDTFLPLAEQSNLMPAVTAFVLGQALTDCAQLRDAGFPLRVSVNISAADLIDNTLPDLVGLHLAEHRLDPRMLVVEVTEDTVMADRVRALLVLHRLRAADVQVSVDDYGTGQSSLSYLRDLPISEIKLDRTFLSGLPFDTHNAAIVRSTIQLAHALDLPIVSEGVEDRVALDWLGEIGCDIGQGFHIARPLPLADLREWLASISGTGWHVDPAPATVG